MFYYFILVKKGKWALFFPFIIFFAEDIFYICRKRNTEHIANILPLQEEGIFPMQSTNALCTYLDQDGP